VWTVCSDQSEGDHMFTIQNVRVGSLPIRLRREAMLALTDGISGDPVAGLRGTHRALGVTYLHRGGKTWMRPYIIPNDPRTPAQATCRDSWNEANKYWCRLSDADRADWNSYGRSNPKPDSAKGPPRNPGQAAFIRVHVVRLPLGMGFRHPAPRNALPPRPGVIIQMPVDNPRAFSFRLEHSVAEVAGMRIQIELTPPTLAPTRAPYEPNFRWLQPGSPGSFTDLCASGHVYTVENACCEVAPGQRYGIRVRLVTPEGATGPASTGDFIREPYLQPPPATPVPDPLAPELGTWDPEFFATTPHLARPQAAEACADRAHRCSAPEGAEPLGARATPPAQWAGCSRRQCELIIDVRPGSPTPSNLTPYGSATPSCGRCRPRTQRASLPPWLH